MGQSMKYAHVVVDLNSLIWSNTSNDDLRQHLFAFCPQLAHSWHAKNVKTSYMRPYGHITDKLGLLPNLSTRGASAMPVRFPPYRQICV